MFQLFSLQPHRGKNFKLSTDPFFVEKVRNVVGLYLDPPDHAVVLSVDEKSRIQALNRTQPVLPTGLGHVEGVTHDYVRHGTTTLFAALDIASGTVLTECKPRHRHQEFLSFIGRIDQAVPEALDVHLIVDNYSTHKHAKVRLWLAARPAASEQGRAQVEQLAEEVQRITGDHVELGYVDQGYTGEAAQSAAARHGIALEVVKHTEAKRGLRAVAAPLGR